MLEDAKTVPSLRLASTRVSGLVGPPNSATINLMIGGCVVGLQVALGCRKVHVWSGTQYSKTYHTYHTPAANRCIRGVLFLCFFPAGFAGVKLVC